MAVSKVTEARICATPVPEPVPTPLSSTDILGVAITGLLHRKVMTPAGRKSEPCLTGNGNLRESPIP
jgi:hypothetical protein